MGKGGGCVPSKTKPPIGGASSDHDEPIINYSSSTIEEEQQTVVKNHHVPIKRKLKIFIVFYSMYGHVETLAKRLKKGVDAIDGVEAVLYRVPETFSPEILSQMKVPLKDDEIPVISPAQLTEADGLLFGFPTRYGTMAAQMKSFFDSTGGPLWEKQKLAGVPAGFFVSTGTQGGGQETTAWTAITQLVHHGMLYVPIGYTFGAGMMEMDSIRGGSPYGAGVFSGDGSRKTSEVELALAEFHGKYMATIVKRIAHL
ncbi:probable NAD(P)H dehydrogenase (quinone) FQR1-like 2 [Impatiens glandulifera]|uniref:probable NAD(P)H dehydrogenase (quinone) FQR1-like 2 n=1 Tax=Impatiens glandulifera TaxID=253017 RepID=UPI001FB16556|nr:probable NAD(P)H dehydrogenase (quinone) FQR1-like 2 [Impatiens glandulifera]